MNQEGEAEILKRLDRIEALLARLAGEPSPAPAAEPEPLPAPEEWLPPCTIAYRLNLSEAFVRKLCQRGLTVAHPGIRKDAGRWRATVTAIRQMQGTTR